MHAFLLCLGLLRHARGLHSHLRHSHMQVACNSACASPHLHVPFTPSCAPPHMHVACSMIADTTRNVGTTKGMQREEKIRRRSATIFVTILMLHRSAYSYAETQYHLLQYGIWDLILALMESRVPTQKLNWIQPLIAFTITTLSTFKCLASPKDLGR
jgi:hypothetical protein